MTAIVPIVIIIQSIGLFSIGKVTFIPKKPVTIVGTVSNSDQTVKNCIVSFRLLFKILLEVE